MNCIKSLKIGFKYCGGCNPRYDRKAFYEEFKACVDEDMDTSLAREDEKYDWLIVLVGCSNNCADISRLNFEHKIVIAEYRQVDDVLASITALKL